MYLDTAKIKDIECYSQYDWVNGITTNPTLMRKIRGKNSNNIIEDILKVINDKDLFIQISGNTTKELVVNADKLVEKFQDKISLKIQTNLQGFEAVKIIKEKYPNIKTLGTVVFSVEQAFLAGLAGFDWVAPYFNRMENSGIDASKVIESINKLYVKHSLETKILGASFKNTSQVMKALLAGANDVTIPPEILIDMLNNKLAIESIEKFNKHAMDVNNR